MNIKEKFLDLLDKTFFPVRMFMERRKYGFDQRELWSLDNTIAKFALPRLKRLKNILHGYPSELSEEEWIQILDKMIWSMNYILTEWDHEDDWTVEKQLQNDKRCQEGLDLFGKWFRALWD